MPRRKFAFRPGPAAAAPTVLALAAAFLIVPTGSAQDLVLTNASVVDVTTGSITPNAVIVVAGGKIRSVGPAGPAGIPAGVRTVDVGGMFVTPGLMDAHVHIASLDQARRALQSGVTTARSMGAGNYADVGLRELGKSGAVDVPEMLAAGYHIRPRPAEELYFDHPELGPYMESGIRGPEAVRAMVRAVLSRGVDFVKTTSTERAGLPDTDPRKQLYWEDELRVMVEEAGARGIGVSSHAHGDAGARAAVVAGVRSIEHGTFMSPETLDLMAERGTYLVPTMAIVFDLTQPGGDYDNATLRLRGQTMLPRMREMVRAAHQKGVRIIASTDTGYGPGSTVRIGHELLEFVGIGMTPLQAIQAATVNAAEFFGVDDHTGRIAPGMDADLVVVERNPLEDVGVFLDVQMVVNDGRVSMAKGDQFGEGPRPVS